MADTMKPFADDRTCVQVGGLMVENGTERISVSGALDLSRDRQGLEHARALQSVFDAVVRSLEAEPNLPVKAAAPEVARTTTARNPFA